MMTRKEKLDVLFAEYTNSPCLGTQWNFNLQETYEDRFPGESVLTEEDFDYFNRDLSDCDNCGWSFSLADLNPDGYCESCAQDLEEEEEEYDED